MRCEHDARSTLHGTITTVDSGLLPESSGLGTGQREKPIICFVKQERKVEEKAKEHSGSSERRSNPNEPFRADVTAKEEKVEEEDLETRASTQQRSRFRDLPEDLAALYLDRVFDDEDSLKAALEELNIADEPIVLCDDGKA